MYISLDTEANFQQQRIFFINQVLPEVPHNKLLLNIIVKLIVKAAHSSVQ